MYRETDASIAARAVLAEQHKAMAALDLIPEGRPSKKDRRLINRLRGR
jgi:ribosome-associated heat shock protein Hsp15